MKTALITGVNGMDGSHLAEHLLDFGYNVHGTIRRSSTPNLSRIKDILTRITLHEADLTDQGSLNRAVKSASPDEVYNLAAQSFVGVSWEIPAATADVTGFGAVRVFEAVREYVNSNTAAVRVYQASTSEMFGNARPRSQNESTPFAPHSPYGVSKVFAHQMADVYRKSFGMHIACGILFNHEGPRRGTEFVTRKITKAVAEISRGRREKLGLGNLDASRDWGYAGDFVKAMHLMLQQEQPTDYVIGTGVTRTIREFLDAAFASVGIEDWTDYVYEDPQFFRPVELHTLRADPSKAKQELGWEPCTDFHNMVEMMVKSDLKSLS